MKNWVFADGTNEGQANGAQKSVGTITFEGHKERCIDTF